MFVNPGEGNASHTHEVEEVFFVLKGHLKVFLKKKVAADKSTARSAPGNAFPAHPAWSMATLMTV